MASKGAKTVGELREWIKSGQSLEAAAQKAGVKPEKIPPFTLIEETEAKPDKEKSQKNTQEFVIIRNAASQLKPGEMTDLVPWENGGLIVVLEKQDPPDPAKYAQQKAEFDQRYLKNKQEIVFYEWLHDRQREAGLSQSSTSG